MLALSAQAAADLPSVEIGQQDIQDQQIIRYQTAQRQCILSTGEQIDGILTLFQTGLQVWSEIWMVFDH